MRGQSYRLNRETSGLMLSEGGQEIVSIPAGAIITVEDHLPGETRLVEVNWNRRKVMMFSMDIRDRGKLVDRKTAD